MPESTPKKRVSALLIVLSFAGLLALVAACGAAFMLWRYVRTDYVGADVATREFENVRAHFAGQQPLVEYPALRPPIVHRDPSAPRRELHTLHLLAYDAGKGKLHRVDAPSTIVRLTTVDGRIRLMGVGMLGDDRDRISLEDLERHGPGLVLDFSGGVAWQMATSDALLGTNTNGSRLLVWTD